MERSSQKCIQYRPVREASFSQGKLIRMGGREIELLGDLEVVPGEAVAVELSGVRGVTPPLITFAEVISCEVGDSQRFKVKASIKGIKAQ
jgi:hypothetical protein